MKTYTGLQNGYCTGGLIKAAKFWQSRYMTWMGDTYFQNSFLYVNYNVEKGTILSEKWFKAYIFKSGTLVSYSAFFTGNKNRAPRYGILWRAACTDVRSVCRARICAARRLMYGMVLRNEHWKVLIPNKCALPRGQTF